MIEQELLMLAINYLAVFCGGLLFGIGLMTVVNWMKRDENRRFTLELMRQSQAERFKDLELVNERLKEAFTAISYEALNKNTERFLSIAGETLKHQIQSGEQNLEAKKGLIDQTLETISKELAKVNEVICQMEKDRELKFGEISTQLKTAVEQTAKLQETTSHLKEILANSRIRGQWGERMAEDVLRAAGFIEGINYRKQLSSPEGNRPDFTFLLPKNLIINMDVKFPLDNYLQFLKTEDNNLKESFRQQFIKDVRNRIREVIGRDYINPEENTVDYVLVFIPNEQIYGFIHEIDGSIIDEALKNKVVLCSPLTLYAFLAIIRQAVEHFNLEQTTSKILSLLAGFHKQWEFFCNAFERMGKRLEDAQKEYLALVSTRRHQLEKPLQMIEDLRRRNYFPAEPESKEELAAAGEEELMFNDQRIKNE
jgi:DNA recombination protein RmuC